MSALKITTREEQGGVYVGLWAPPTTPHIPVLLSPLTFFSGFIHVMLLFIDRGMNEER